jgi:hypothetical protein
MRIISWDALGTDRMPEITFVRIGKKAIRALRKTDAADAGVVNAHDAEEKGKYRRRQKAQ